jgi:oligoribonuclease
VKKFLFIDLETTGLVPIGNKILEFAMIITDDKLNELASYSTPVHVSDYDLQGMSHWCETTHTASGLVDEVKKGTKLIHKVEKEVLDILADHFSGPQQPVVAGNSVHFDKSFIAAHMPNLNKRLHYRIIDVSSFKEALGIYAGLSYTSRPTAHRALADIRDSIYYLKNYLERFK